MQTFLQKIGFAKDKIHFVPISGLLGINLDSTDDLPESLTKWYNEDRGKDEKNKMPMCLMDIIDGFRGMKRPFNKPARVCVYDYYNKD